MRKWAGLLLMLVAGVALAQPVEYFFKRAEYTGMTISPDGTALAALAPVAGRQNLVVIDLKTRKPRVVTALRTRDVVWAIWVNSNRLVYSTGTLDTAAFESRGGGLFAVNRDGSNMRLLGEGIDERSSEAARATIRPLNLVRRLPGESNDIIAQEYVYGAESESRTGQLYRVDTTNGRRTELSFGKPDSARFERWVVDDKGVPRVMVATEAARERIWYRASEQSPWQKLDELASLAPGWDPLAVDRDDKTLLVRDQRSRDKAAIVRYDPATRTFGEVLAEHPQVNLGGLVSEWGQIVGVSYNADKPGYAWFDEELARVYRTIDAAFPGMTNSMSWSRDRSLFLVFSRSDKSQGSYFLYDAKARKMEWLLDRASWQKPEQHAAMEPVRYLARDGLPIPAYLTRPRGKEKNLPLVVMVHGGPWVGGDSWRYHPEVQFLASRGFAVLQPNFRGTTRYGWKHFTSSFGQWGLAMQDDVTDGVKWAVAEGIADPKRVCIYGGSYGGYATMMALAKEPDMFKCGINYVGVTDLDLLLTASWSDMAYSEFVQHTAKDMVGDPVKDAERLRATSPLNLASKIKAPVLMAYGGVDFRVPIEHGTRMKSALERAGNAPQWILADAEGHGFQDPKSRGEFYGAMEKFLKQHLGEP